jgi:hypothetical protein
MSHLTQFPMVSLTVLEGEQGRSQRTVQVAASRLLVYEQHSNFTRLRLKEEGWLRVREGTDEIDRRLRMVAAQQSGPG